jgi:hypothetical protein
MPPKKEPLREEFSFELNDERTVYVKEISKTIYRQMKKEEDVREASAIERLLKNRINVSSQAVVYYTRLKGTRWFIEKDTNILFQDNSVGQKEVIGIYNTKEETCDPIPHNHLARLQHLNIPISTKAKVARPVSQELKPSKKVKEKALKVKKEEERGIKKRKKEKAEEEKKKRKEKENLKDEDDDTVGGKNEKAKDLEVDENEAAVSDDENSGDSEESEDDTEDDD